MKRFCLLLLALVCLTAPALADGGDISTDDLPSCYRYVVEGANAVYSGGPVPVYADKNPASATIGMVQPWQHIHVRTVDRALGMAYVFIYANDTQANWNFGDDCLKGWLYTRYISPYTDPDKTYVVRTDKPGDRLNLRRDGYLNVSLGKFYAGTIVTQIGEPRSDGLMKVKIGHAEGLMDMTYLTHGMVTDSAELPVLTVANRSGTGVNLRKQPETTAEKVQFAPNGAQVTVLAVRDDNWYLVAYENEIGVYAQASLLTPRLQYNMSSGSGSSAAQPVPDGAKVVANPDPRDRLNLRVDPSETAHSLGKFYNGTPVTVIGTRNDWSHVTVGAQEGWMKSVYLKAPGTVADASYTVQTHVNVAFTERPDTHSVSTVGFSAGTRILVYGDLDDDWLYACWQGNWGYIEVDAIERNLNIDLTHENGAAG